MDLLLVLFFRVIGVGFYPLLGNRVGVDLVALYTYMGIFQRFKSRFRITTNGGQCISCGNCSTYARTGIDVRAYAQTRKYCKSKVGGDVYVLQCAQEELKLENGTENTRLKSN